MLKTWGLKVVDLTFGKPYWEDGEVRTFDPMCEDAEFVWHRDFEDREIEILEGENSYIFYQIDSVNNKIPSLNNDKFKKQIKNLLFQKEKYEFNKDILDK